jgi:hypothetical protein
VIKGETENIKRESISPKPADVDEYNTLKAISSDVNNSDDKLEKVQ